MALKHLLCYDLTAWVSPRRLLFILMIRLCACGTVCILWLVFCFAGKSCPFLSSEWAVLFDQVAFRYILGILRIDRGTHWSTNFALATPFPPLTRAILVFKTRQSPVVAKVLGPQTGRSMFFFQKLLFSFFKILFIAKYHPYSCVQELTWSQKRCLTLLKCLRGILVEDTLKKLK